MPPVPEKESVHLVTFDDLRVPRCVVCFRRFDETKETWRKTLWRHVTADSRACSKYVTSSLSPTLNILVPAAMLVSVTNTNTKKLLAAAVSTRIVVVEKKTLENCLVPTTVEHRDLLLQYWDASDAKKRVEQRVESKKGATTSEKSEKLKKHLLNLAHERVPLLSKASTLKLLPIYWNEKKQMAYEKELDEVVARKMQRPEQIGIMAAATRNAAVCGVFTKRGHSIWSTTVSSLIVHVVLRKMISMRDVCAIMPGWLRKPMMVDLLEMPVGALKNDKEKRFAKTVSRSFTLEHFPRCVTFPSAITPSSSSLLTQADKYYNKVRYPCVVFVQHQSTIDLSVTLLQRDRNSKLPAIHVVCRNSTDRPSALLEGIPIVRCSATDLSDITRAAELAAKWQRDEKTDVIIEMVMEGNVVDETKDLLDSLGERLLSDEERDRLELRILTDVNTSKSDCKLPKGVEFS